MLLPSSGEKSEDGGNIFLWNISNHLSHLPDYMVTSQKTIIFKHQCFRRSHAWSRCSSKRLIPICQLHKDTLQRTAALIPSESSNLTIFRLWLFIIIILYQLQRLLYIEQGGHWKSRYLSICLERLMETTRSHRGKIQTMYLLSESLSCYCLVRN